MRHLMMLWHSVKVTRDYYCVNCALILSALVVAELSVNPDTILKDPFDVVVPPDSGFRFKMIDGVMTIYENDEKFSGNVPADKYIVPNLQTYLADRTTLLNAISDGPL